jgi:hypothetical protein
MVDYSCQWMRDCIVCIIEELRRCNVLQSWVDPQSVWEGILSPCQPCGSNNPSPRKCMGWELRFRGHEAMILVPSSPRGTPLQLTLEGQFVTTSTRKRHRTWTSEPFSECSASISLKDVSSGTLLTRQHVDLANPTQPGPAWHVQLGGVGSGTPRHLEVLRWPSPPTDLILLVELALFLLHNDAWRTVKDAATWSSFVRASEELTLTHYRSALESHWSTRHRSSSWLASQCNQTGSLRPRPT